MSRIFSLSVQTQRALSHSEVPWEFLSFKKIDSTNNYAKENAPKLTAPTLILAEHQTAGRGRNINTWTDEGHGHQLLSTWFIDLPGAKLDPRWTIAMGYFVYASLQSTWHDALFSIKAPNDIFLNDKKVAGILTETTQGTNGIQLFVGLGLNVFGRPASMHSTAASLVDHLGPKLDEKSWQKWILSFSTMLTGFNSFISDAKWLSQISVPLTEALNRNTHYKTNGVKNIKENGSIELYQGYLNWLEL